VRLFLRRKLDDKGLDVDGSREMLIRRLKEGENEDGYDNLSLRIFAAIYPRRVISRQQCVLLIS
jgi:hypothetical protein